MVKGLRVVFSPNPASRALYSYRVPGTGAHGTVTAAWTSGGLRTYLAGPGGGLVYVCWDGDGLICGVSMRDLRLEPGEGGQRC
jgi:tetrahydromethanopterin S-methyltransferase subunit D